MRLEDVKEDYCLVGRVKILCAISAACFSKSMVLYYIQIEVGEVICLAELMDNLIGDFVVLLLIGT